MSLLKQKYAQVKKSATIIVTGGGNKEYRWALGDQNAFQVLLNDKATLTYYGHIGNYFADYGILDKQQQAQIEKTLYVIP